jgi:hypothetical protein
MLQTQSWRGSALRWQPSGRAWRVPGPTTSSAAKAFPSRKYLVLWGEATAGARTGRWWSMVWNPICSILWLHHRPSVLAVGTLRARKSAHPAAIALRHDRLVSTAHAVLPALAAAGRALRQTVTLPPSEWKPALLDTDMTMARGALQPQARAGGPLRAPFSGVRGAGVGPPPSAHWGGQALCCQAHTLHAPCCGVHSATGTDPAVTGIATDVGPRAVAGHALEQPHGDGAPWLAQTVTSDGLSAMPAVMGTLGGDLSGTEHDAPPSSPTSAPRAARHPPLRGLALPTAPLRPA